MIRFIVLFSLLFSVLGFQSANAQIAQPIKEWTFLVYMNADNDLYSASFLNLAQMERVGSSPQVNVVVQFDPKDPRFPTFRWLMQRNPNPKIGFVTSPALEKLPETDMGDWRTLAQFLVWGAQKFPAKHYAVFIWNHGAGWMGVSADENPKHIMKIPELRLALDTFNQAVAQQRGLDPRQPMVDILNFDACLMASLEVAFELRSSVRILAGSQYVVPGAGEDYEAILKPVVMHPDVDPRRLAEYMTYNYGKQYAAETPTPDAQGTSFIALDLSKVGNLAAAVNALSQGITSAGLTEKFLGVVRDPNEMEGFDLIDGIKAARSVAAGNSELLGLLDRVAKVYGYPFADQLRVTNGKPYAVLSVDPGVVAYRASGENWQKVELKQYPFLKGYYGAEIPSAQGKRVDYVLIRADGTRNAITQVMGDSSVPVIFHSQFPDSSPVISDIYNVYTKDSHGITLYALSALQQLVKTPGFSGQAVVQQLLRDYRQLQFATIGAPAWSNLFGL